MYEDSPFNPVIAMSHIRERSVAGSVAIPVSAFEFKTWIPASGAFVGPAGLAMAGLWNDV